jgi:hypothetical protein
VSSVIFKTSPFLFHIGSAGVRFALLTHWLNNRFAARGASSALPPSGLPRRAAPDFKLKTLDVSGEVQLSAFRGKCPVALIFGSYT